MRALIACVAALAAAPCGAQLHGDWPPVVEIVVPDDAVTQERVILREMALGVGDPADPQRIADSRQALLDLGLFREVSIETEERDDGVALHVHLGEKRYVLAVPRVSASSDGDYGYGLHARVNNLWGRNHMFEVRGEQGRYPEDRLREEEQSARLRYVAPYLWGRHGLHADLEYVDRVAPLREGGNFDERIDRAALLFLHDFRDTRPRRGWIVTTGLQWQTQDATGPLAPPRDGRTTALVLGLDYTDLRFHVYSETGRHVWVRTEVARDGWFSDYGYRRFEGRFVEHLGLDGAAHQNLNLIAAAGVLTGGPRRVNTFSLGGSSALRGYELDHIEGDRYGYLAAEYLRPMFGLDWLRVLVLAESGVTGNSVVPGARSGVYTNVGAGVRVRIAWFMNLELEVGVAYPLRGGDGPQLFAGST